jgi:hypothetical protein
MTIGNMREWGIEHVVAYCRRIGCGHHVIVNAKGLPEDLAVPDVGLRTRCSKCGSRNVQTRPNWAESNWQRGR